MKHKKAKDIAAKVTSDEAPVTLETDPYKLQELENLAFKYNKLKEALVCYTKASELTNNKRGKGGILEEKSSGLSKEKIL